MATYQKKQEDREVSTEELGTKKRTRMTKNRRWPETYANIEQYIGGIRNSESWKVLKKTKDKST